MLNGMKVRKIFFIVTLLSMSIICFAKEVEATNFGVANASVGDYIIRTNGKKIILVQADINYAKRQLGVQLKESSKNWTSTQTRAENGDVYGADNDGDGRVETVFVRGYYRKDGTYVRSHYRAKPRRKY
jgi:hypothetical protein